MKPASRTIIPLLLILGLLIFFVAENWRESAPGMLKTNQGAQSISGTTLQSTPLAGIGSPPLDASHQPTSQTFTHTTELELTPSGASTENNTSRSEHSESVHIRFDRFTQGLDDDQLDHEQRELAAMSGSLVLLEAVARFRLSDNEAERTALLGVIRYENDPDAVATLAALADQPEEKADHPLKLAIHDTLGQIGTPEAIRALIRQIQRSDQKGSFMHAFGLVTKPDAIPVLMEVVNAPLASYDDQTRCAAIRALGNFPSVEVRGYLADISELYSEPLRHEAMVALTRASGRHGGDFTP